MKYLIKISLFIFAAGLVSCSEDYLETRPSEELSSEDINNAGQYNPQVLDGYLVGLYNTMYTTGSGGTNLRHDDFGQKGWDIYTDMLGSDMVLAGNTYGWYSYIANYTATVDYTSNSSYMPWRYYYRIIRGANTLIGGYDLNAIPDDAESKSKLGQGLAIRGYSYLNLMHLYVNDNTDLSSPAVPLMLEANLDALPLSTTGEVYNQIITDLELAVELLDNGPRSNKRDINKDVARGILGYAYAAVGRNAEAAAVTKAVIDEGNFPLLTAEELAYDNATASGGGFNNINTPAWMWGQDVTLEMGLDLVSWWGQVDNYTYSYAYAGDPKTIDNDLYAQISSDDVRKKQFVGLGQKKPTGKFYAPDRSPGGQRSVVTDYIYMRIEEMYLLYAETAAKSGAEGGEAGARQALKDLMEIRVDDASYVDALSGQALIDEIRLQTRIELWGEGKTYWSMKRNQETRTRGANHLFFAGESFQYNDPRLTLDIPQSEIQNNPNID